VLRTRKEFGCYGISFDLTEPQKPVDFDCSTKLFALHRWGTFKFKPGGRYRGAGRRDVEMCLILGSDGHLNIKMLCEQIFPQIDGSVGDPRMEATECYDFIIRSHCPRDTPLNHLYILSPHSCGDETDFSAVFPLIETHSRFDGIFLDAQHSKGERWRLEFAGEGQPIAFEVTRLRAQLQPFPWPSPTPRLLGAWSGTGKTLAKVTFPGQKIRRYDREDDGATTYWLRLAFRPRVKSFAEGPVRFGSAIAGGTQPLFYVQPCTVMSPDLVVADLTRRLKIMARDTDFGAETRLLRDAVLNKCLLNDGASCRIEDHRVSLVIDPHRFLVLNSQVEGSAAFIEVEAIPGTKTCHRKWYAGARHFPQTDPVYTAYQVHAHLKSWADKARPMTKEQITAEVAPEAHANIAHVTEALKALDYVRTEDGQKFYAGKELAGHPALFSEPTSEFDFAEDDAGLRDRLFGENPVPHHPGEVSRFRAKGFQIHFDLAFVS